MWAVKFFRHHSGHSQIVSDGDAWAKRDAIRLSKNVDHCGIGKCRILLDDKFPVKGLYL